MVKEVDKFSYLFIYLFIYTLWKWNKLKRTEGQVREYRLVPNFIKL